VKVFLLFLVGAFVAGGLPVTKRVAVQRPWLGIVACAVIAISFYSLRVLL
jgi:hypothetical protein